MSEHDIIYAADRMEAAVHTINMILGHGYGGAGFQLIEQLEIHNRNKEGCEQLTAERDQLRAERDALRADQDSLQATFDLRRAADMRGIELWQKAHPDKQDTWPDHADMTVWILEELDRAHTELETAQRQNAASRRAAVLALGLIPASYSDCHQYEEIKSALELDAGRSFVPRSELESVTRSASEMRDVLTDIIAHDHLRYLSCPCGLSAEHAVSSKAGADYVHRSELESVKRQAAAMRQALEDRSKVLVSVTIPEWEECCSNALSDHAGLDFVPRSELEALLADADVLAAELETAVHCGFKAGKVLAAYRKARE